MLLCNKHWCKSFPFFSWIVSPPKCSFDTFVISWTQQHSSRLASSGRQSPWVLWRQNYFFTTDLIGIYHKGSQLWFSLLMVTAVSQALLFASRFWSCLKKTSKASQVWSPADVIFIHSRTACFLGLCPSEKCFSVLNTTGKRLWFVPHRYHFLLCENNWKQELCKHKELFAYLFERAHAFRGMRWQ